MEERGRRGEGREEGEGEGRRRGLSQSNREVSICSALTACPLAVDKGHTMLVTHMAT